MALTGSRGYRLIADVLKTVRREGASIDTVDQVTIRLADLFQQEHPVGFNRERFYQNVGLIPMKESDHAIRTG